MLFQSRNSTSNTRSGRSQTIQPPRGVLLNDTDAAKPLTGSELLGLPPFKGLTGEELQRVWACLTWRTLPPGAVVLRQGQHESGVSVIVEGAVKVCACHAEPPGRKRNSIAKTPARVTKASASKDRGKIELETSRPLTLAICGPGEILGEIEAGDHAGHSATVITLQDSHLLWLSTADFARLQQSIPQLNANLVKILIARLRRLSIKSQALARLDLPHRIACELLLLADSYGRREGDFLLLPLHLRQHDLADLVGSTRECVNRALRPLRHYMDFTSEGMLLIRDREGLSDFCHGGL